LAVPFQKKPDKPEHVLTGAIVAYRPCWPSINQLVHSSFQILEIRNNVLTIFGVWNRDEHLRAVNVACRVLEPLIDCLLIPGDVCRPEGG